MEPLNDKSDSLLCIDSVFQLAKLFDVLCTPYYLENQLIYIIIDIFENDQVTFQIMLFYRLFHNCVWIGSCNTEL